ncbi:HigA family addiction module antitoxin [Rhodophyticola sp. CCM32]|uniref:HigA family addiction module antitoxin n=1 Tax=Rhodophyticola sp. CCM32 TaxID=2916397 RepID=UPI001EE4ED2C|nr:HigA family addiction module antitoxin [Rhodophyticola sp. CCM32]
MKNPVHPGAILKHEFLLPLCLSEGQLAKRLGVPRTRIERLTKGTTSMTPDTAFRLARFFGTTPQFWMNMQINHDITHTQVDVSHIEPLRV